MNLQQEKRSKKDDELKGEIVTDKNEGVIEYGSDFTNCESISA